MHQRVAGLISLGIKQANNYSNATKRNTLCTDEVFIEVDVEAACNVPGHYEVGMIAKIDNI